MKEQEQIMNTSPENEGVIADTEHMRVRIIELFYKRLLIW